MKPLPLSNYKQLVWAGEVDTTLSSIPKFYTFDDLGIKGNYFLVKDFRIDFFTEAGSVKIVWEIAYDNTSETVNTNTRYSMTNSRNILLSEKLLGLNKTTVNLLVNNGSFGIFNDNYSAINFNFDINAYIPVKITEDFDLQMKIASAYKDLIGTTYNPFIYAIMTGFVISDSDLDSFSSIKPQPVTVAKDEYIKGEGKIINKKVNKPEFFNNY